ncbi:MAG: sigma-70 family RNA polymerase sigma factor [Saprospiraceae bacterium]|jgi:RNA polymerase sigma factor (sigma-70 family)|nr:sigma-70 family RNA polymerase sigma factor [Saprospiraceae bacterium]MBL0292992.1 sigma-70 family RNA polymerase sigma factor [Saprospiraceae bacterium]
MLETPNRLKQLSDEEVIVRYLDSQKRVYFNILYDRYSNKIFAKCISILKDETKAVDASQEIIIKLVTNLSKFGGNSKFSTWVYSITYNYCIDILRKTKKEQLLFKDESAFNENIPEDEDDVFLTEIMFDRLKILIDKLDETERALLLMKYQDDMMIKEISSIMQITESAIKMRLKRAKDKLKKFYTATFDD